MFFSKTILKLVAYLASVVLFGLCLTAILERDHLQLITKFETLKEVDPRIRAAELADNGDYCQALEYMEYFMDYDYVKQNPAMAGVLQKPSGEAGFFGIQRSGCVERHMGGERLMPGVDDFFHSHGFSDHRRCAKSGLGGS